MRLITWRPASNWIVLLAFLGASAIAASPVHAAPPVPTGEGAHTRTLGKKAIMHVYYFVARTLEITHVESYFFRDVGTCEHSVDAALTLAERRAGHGDLVDAECISISLSDDHPSDDQGRKTIAEL